MNPLSNNRITFVPDVRIATFDRDTVEVRTGVWHTSSITLRDDSQKGVLAEIVEQVREGASPEEIAARHQLGLDEVMTIVGRLNQGGFLALADGIERWDRLPYLVAPTLGAARATRPSRLGLVGPPQAIGFLKAALGGSAARIDSFEASPELSAELSRRDLFLDRDGLQTAAALAPFEDWRGALIVAVLPQFNPILTANLNRLAHLLEFSFLPACIDGPFAMIGPAVVPGKSACFACAESRLLETLRDHALYQKHRQAAAEGKVHVVPADSLDPFQATVVALAAWETANFTNFGTAFTVDKVLTIYAPLMEIVFHQLLRMPACAVCSSRSMLDAPLYSDIMSFINSRVAEVAQ